MIRVVVLGTCGVELQIALLMVGFLKQNICTNTRVLELSVIFNSGCGYINVDATNCAVLVIYAVNILDSLENVLNRVVYGVFARFDCKTLMPHILKCDYLRANLVLRELFSGNMLILHMIRAINAAVHAVV